MLHEGEVIVTGADGMIGANMLGALAHFGVAHVTAVDTARSVGETRYISTLPHTRYLSREELFQGATEDTLGNVAAIVHFGACSDTRERDRNFLLRNNTEYSRVLFSYSVVHDCQFIYASSAATYGDGSLGYHDRERVLKPLNYYAESKYLFDEWVYGTATRPPQWVGLKLFNTYGPYEMHKGGATSVMYHGWQELRHNGTVTLFASDRAEYRDGEQERDFIYVKDVLDVVWFFLSHPEHSGIFNVGTGKARTFNDLARAVFQALGKEPHIMYRAMPEELKGKYQYHAEADMSSLRNIGYTKAFTSLEDGVRGYVQWLERHTATP